MIKGMEKYNKNPMYILHRMIAILRHRISCSEIEGRRERQAFGQAIHLKSALHRICA